MTSKFTNEQLKEWLELNRQAKEGFIFRKKPEKGKKNRYRSNGKIRILEPRERGVMRWI